MRFGLFIPQGWRMDLVGIPPENHWQVMRDLATYADSGPWDSLWVYDH
ncbi:MAG: LLM class F420-dependent oxidoreductase, partial [Mycobacterium sp.]